MMITELLMSKQDLRMQNLQKHHFAIKKNISLFYADIKDSIDKPPTNGLANRFHYE
jgi:hypothetical protein